MDSIKKIIKLSLKGALCCFLLVCFIRVFILDRFVVIGNSMEPTLQDGLPIYVNKLLVGGRIYKSYDFNKGKLDSFRVPGIRKCRVGDIIVFNYPFELSESHIGFTINSVCVKRVVGCPGDTVWIKNSHFLNSSSMQTGIPVRSELALKAQSDSILNENGCLRAGQFASKHWTIKEFGPFVIPDKGMVVYLDSTTIKTYLTLIEYETGKSPLVNTTYSFINNYYFVVGDNLSVSSDSRDFGPIPEQYIIGVVITPK